MQSTYLTTKQVAHMLNLSPKSISRLVASGSLAVAIKAPGKRGAFMFDPSEVEHYRVMRELQTAGKGSTK